MTEENQHLLKEIYQQYNDPVKPLLAEIEAVYEKFPLALYNEIRAMNDHVARAFTSDTDQKATQQIEKAFNHINRITRDCYKFLDLYYKQEAERFDKNICNVDPGTTAEYAKMAEYGKLSDRATELVEYAKQKEHLVSDEETYRNFENAYLAYRELHTFIVNNRREVMLMKRKKRIKGLGSAALSIITFVLGAILTNNNEKIIHMLQHLIKH